MLEQLVLNNFSSGFEPALKLDSSPFILKTCQRTLVLSVAKNQAGIKQIPLSNAPFNELKLHSITGVEAYSFLLQIICGLQSKLIGENEIVGQFKLAYQTYANSKTKCNQVLLILEKLFKDSKEIRSKYLLGLGQKTYSCITRKHIIGKNKAQSVLILGSGQLAEDLINQMKKKTQVFISARNGQRVAELVKLHGITSVPWKDFEEYAKFPFITNSIGCKNSTIIAEEFFNAWHGNHQQRLFIDLGSPSVIKTQLNHADGVMRLKEVFNEGAIHDNYKKQQISDAFIALNEIVGKRNLNFQKKLKNNSEFNRK